MNSNPKAGYTEHHTFTVFITYAKSRWTWDFKSHRPLAFWSNRDAHYANYQCQRRANRLRKNRNLPPMRALPVTGHSANNPCITVPNLKKALEWLNDGEKI